MTGYRKRADGGWTATPEDDTEAEKDHDEALLMNMDLDGAIDWASRNPDDDEARVSAVITLDDVRYSSKAKRWGYDMRCTRVPLVHGRRGMLGESA